MTAFLVLFVAAMQAASLPKTTIVSVTGCVTQAPGDTWMLTNATDPVVEAPPANGSGPQRGAKPSAPPATASAVPASGKNRYRLIGILELGVPDHKGHTVTIKGLLIPGAEKKINVTSVKMIAPTCNAGRT